MSLETIRDQIISEIGERSDYNDLIDDQINYALLEVSTSRRYRELEGNVTTTTDDGQYEYLLPSDCYAIFSIKNEEDDSDTLLTQKRIFSFDMVDETDTGTPKLWARYNNSLIIFGKVPDDNDGDDYEIRLRYWKRHPALALDADNHLLAREVERGIRLKASAFTLRILGQEEKADNREQEYMRWMQVFQTPGQVEDEHAFDSRMDFGTY